MRLLAVGCVLFGVMGVPALAEDNRIWLFNDDPDTSVLQYGTPESDDMLLTMSCEPQAKVMRIVEFVSTDKLKPGTTAKFKLSAGTAALELTGDAVANEMDGSVIIQTSGPPNPRLFSLLKAGPMLVVEVLGGKETIPLAGALPHLPAFEKVCLSKR